MTNINELEELLRKNVISSPPSPLTTQITCVKWVSSLPTLGNLSRDSTIAFKLGTELSELATNTELEKMKNSRTSLQRWIDNYEKVQQVALSRNLVDSSKRVYSIDTVGLKILTNSKEFCQLLQDLGWYLGTYFYSKVFLDQLSKDDPTPPPQPPPTPVPPPPPPTPPTPPDAKREAENRFVEWYNRDCYSKGTNDCAAWLDKMIVNATSQISSYGVVNPQTPDTVWNILFWTNILSLSQKKRSQIRTDDEKKKDDEEKKEKEWEDEEDRKNMTKKVPFIIIGLVIVGGLAYYYFSS